MDRSSNNSRLVPSASFFRSEAACNTSISCRLRIVPREVPLKYVVEMVACLIATVEVAAKNRYSLQEWYRMCGTEMILHDKTRRLLEALISEHEEASA